YYGQVVEMDGQGRLLIPQILRESAQMRGDVAVLGALTHLDVRNMEALQKEMQEQAFTDDDRKALDELGI
ncbi:MAG: division/cell wall cluster transcriptional repressor MraZ, partial [Terriglobales bacterium]